MIVQINIAPPIHDAIMIIVNTGLLIELDAPDVLTSAFAVEVCDGELVTTSVSSVEDGLTMLSAGGASGCGVV